MGPPPLQGSGLGSESGIASVLMRYYVISFHRDLVNPGCLEEETVASIAAEDPDDD
jgi:hypothetical protein